MKCARCHALPKVPHPAQLALPTTLQAAATATVIMSAHILCRSHDCQDSFFFFVNLVYSSCGWLPRLWVLENDCAVAGYRNDRRYLDGMSVNVEFCWMAHSSHLWMAMNMCCKGEGIAKKTHIIHTCICNYIIIACLPFLNKNVNNQEIFLLGSVFQHFGTYAIGIFHRIRRLYWIWQRKNSILLILGSTLFLVNLSVTQKNLHCHLHKPLLAIDIIIIIILFI